MNFFEKIKNFFKIYDELKNINKKIAKIEEKLEKSYIFSDVSNSSNVVYTYSAPEGCSDGCVFSKNFSSTNGEKTCVKCGKIDFDMN